MARFWRINSANAACSRLPARGAIGTAQVARAPADGHTVLVSSLGPFVIAPHLLKNVPYDAGRDLDLLTVAVQAPNVLVVPAASPYKTVADVIAAAKKSPDKLTFASSGNGSSDHLTAELFWLQTGTSGVHVPYKGGAPAVSDLLGDGSGQRVHEAVHVLVAHGQRARPQTSLGHEDTLVEHAHEDALGHLGVLGPGRPVVRQGLGRPVQPEQRADAGYLPAPAGGRQQPRDPAPQPVAECVEVLSQGFTLLPGDVIATGTPEGVGAALGTFLKAGDRLEAEVERIGVLANRVTAPAP